MKKILSLLLPLSVGSFVAQQSLNYPLEISYDCIEDQNLKTPTVINQPKTGDTIWSEDFGNGFPSTWSIEDVSGICPWVWSNDGSWGYFNSNNGSIAGTAINSSTANNGFLICDPDSANNATYGQPSGANYQYLESYFTTSSIDLSAYPAVVLEFQQYFRYNNAIDLKVMVSNDSITWTTFTVQGNSSNNTASANVDTVKLNISSVAGNQPSVFIKIGWSARVYFWMIDDMKILEADPNDLAIKTTYFETLGLPYYQIPATQLTDINFSATVVNNGANDQPNSKLTVDVNGSSIGTSSTTTINSSNSDSLYLSQSYVPPPSLGAYSIKWTVSSDSIDNTPSDNFKSLSIEVTDYIYARDNNIKDGNRWNQGEAYEIGNVFDVINNQEVWAVDFVVDDATEPGSIVYGILYSIDAASGDFVFEQNTDDYVLTASEINNEATITIPFFSPHPLNAGRRYLIMIGTYGDGGATNDLVVRTGGVSIPQTSFKYDGSDLTWYYTTRTPMVRMNFDPVWSVHENTSENPFLLQNQPNPFSAQTNIEYTINSAGNCGFEITSLSGEIVFEKNLGFKPKGRHSITFDSSEMPSGIYFYSLIYDNRRFSKKMIIQ